jgi:hypothetical protein
LDEESLGVASPNPLLETRLSRFLVCLTVGSHFPLTSLTFPSRQPQYLPTPVNISQSLSISLQIASISVNILSISVNSVKVSRRSYRHRPGTALGNICNALGNIGITGTLQTLQGSVTCITCNLLSLCIDTRGRARSVIGSLSTFRRAYGSCKCKVKIYDKARACPGSQAGCQ